MEIGSRDSFNTYRGCASSDVSAQQSTRTFNNFPQRHAGLPVRKDAEESLGPWAWSKTARWPGVVLGWLQDAIGLGTISRGRPQHVAAVTVSDPASASRYLKIIVGLWLVSA